MKAIQPIGVKNTSQPIETIAIELSFPKISPENNKNKENKEGGWKLDASKYTLPFNLGHKLMSLPFVVSVSLATFYTAQSYLEPFFNLNRLLLTSHSFDIISAFKIMVSTHRSRDFAFKGIVEGDPNYPVGPYEPHLNYVTEKIKIFNKMFYVPDVEVLRRQFAHRYDSLFFAEEYQKIGGKIKRPPGHMSHENVYDKVYPLLFDNNLSQQYPLFFRQFFSILLFVMESNYIPILIGVVGGSALVFNFARKIMRPKEKKKDNENKFKIATQSLDFSNSPKKQNSQNSQGSQGNQKMDEFINVISEIGEHFQFSFKEERENKTHIFLNFEHVMDGKTKHIQQYKHFLKALPQNVFINQVNHVFGGKSSNVFPPKRDDPEASARIEEVDNKMQSGKIRQQLKKYADLHTKRYAFQYPTTLTQKVKSYVMYKPSFSKDSLS